MPTAIQLEKQEFLDKHKPTRLHANYYTCACQSNFLFETLERHYAHKEGEWNKHLLKDYPFPTDVLYHRTTERATR